MEEEDDYGELSVDAFKKYINSQYEENEKSLRDHFQSILSQQKEIERQKQKLYSFVCDWQ